MLRQLMIVGCCVLASCDTLGIASSSPKWQGDFSGSLVYTTSGNVACRTFYNVSGTVTMDLKDASGTISGDGTVKVTETVSSADPPPCGGPGPNRHWDGNGQLTGTTSNLGFSTSYTDDGVVKLTTTTTFSGVKSGDTITGTVTVQHSGTGVVNGSTIHDDGQGTFVTTLHLK